PLVLDCLFVSANPNVCVNHFCGEGSLIQQPNQKGYSNDPQKYKGYDREGSDNRHKRDKCHHKAAQYKEYQE
ncbi:hypothetical protein, partial [Phocaeicola sp.]|uniref:hypothetical protein n=1 Tax=Phocaeicola sp. TaxID=2773926 RepID=UPI003AEF9A81